MPTLIALGLPSTIANATSNVALQPAAMASVWAYRHGLEPVMGVTMRRMAALTFVFALWEVSCCSDAAACLRPDRALGCC